MTAGTHQPLLQTHNLSTGYGGRTKHILFDNLNIALYSGQLTCFMGPNGVGKSTLIRTLAGLQKALHGNIATVAYSGSVTQQVSVVLTDKITTNLTVKELVTFGRYPYLDWSIRLGEMDKKIISDAIDRVRIGHLQDEKIFRLSDGQLQMVMIARAVAQDTPIILLDEPTAHLDLNNRVEVMKLLRTLAHEMNKAILVSTHELDLALQTADLVWLAGRGKNIVTGIPEDLVLNGAFDDIFQFKGFDLKTGKVKHAVTQKNEIQLTGEGAEYLWTRNALERNGYSVTTGKSLWTITLHSPQQWLVQKENDTQLFTTLYEVLQFLSTD